MQSHVSENFCMYCGIKYVLSQMTASKVGSLHWTYHVINVAKIEPTKEEPSIKVLFLAVGAQINKLTTLKKD